MSAPVNDAMAADLVATIGALTAAVSRMDANIAKLAADVAMLLAMADAWRQAEGRAAYPQPAGWVR